MGRWFLITNTFKTAIVIIDLFVPDPVIQGGVAIAVVFTMLMATLRVKPYERRESNGLEAKLFGSVRTCKVLFKVSVPGNSPFTRPPHLTPGSSHLPSLPPSLLPSFPPPSQQAVQLIVALLTHNGTIGEDVAMVIQFLLVVIGMCTVRVELPILITSINKNHYQLAHWVEPGSKEWYLGMTIYRSQTST